MSDKELLDAGYRKYTGESIDAYFNINVCIHSGKCVKGLPTVFDLNQKPWINLNTDQIDEIKRTIDICPSGALKYIERIK